MAGWTVNYCTHHLCVWHCYSYRFEGWLPSCVELSLLHVPFIILLDIYGEFSESL